MSERVTYGARYRRRLRWTALVCALWGLLSSMSALSRGAQASGAVAVFNIVGTLILMLLIGLAINLLVAAFPSRR